MALARSTIKRTLTDPRLIIAVCLLLVIYQLRKWLTLNIADLPRSPSPPVNVRLEYKITRTWDDEPLHGVSPRILLSLEEHNDVGIKLLVQAPFFNDPPNPGGTVGQPFSGLWDYEVVEMFFLNDENKYLEVELCPYGQHLVLLLNGQRKMFKDQLPLQYKSSILGKEWEGEAVIPADYFPKQVTKINAYAIHGTGKDRTYKALYPVPHGQYKDPDFHRLEYFKPAQNFSTLLPSNVGDNYKSKMWEN